MPRPVAVTGATGFIGRHLVAALRARGHAVRALTRQPLPAADNLTWIQGDLADPSALGALVDGATHVIHCAGTVRGCSADQFRLVNVQGTAHLVAVARQQPHRPAILLISSLAAREPGLSWYAASKHAAERILLQQAGDLAWTAFRPPAVYGPGDREIRPLLRAMHRGWLPVVAPPDARFSLLHVLDLAEAAVAWMEARPGQERLELDDGTPGGYHWRAIAEIAEAAWQRRVHMVRVPLPLLRSAALLNLALSSLLRRPAMLTPGKVRELTHGDWVCDNTAAIRALGWRPRLRFADALREPGLVEL